MVEQGFRLDSNSLEFGNVHYGETATRLVRLMGSEHSKSVRVSFEGDASANLTLSLGEWTDSDMGESAPIRLKLGPLAQSCGDYNTRAFVRVGSELLFPIQIHYQVAPNLTVFPPSVWLDSPNSQGCVRFGCPKAAGDFRITSVRSKNQLTSARFSDTSQSSLLISRRADADRVASIQNDEIVITYVIGSSKTQEAVTVPVFWNTVNLGAQQ